MYRIDNVTAASALPEPAAAGTPGFFTNGDPSTGTPRTIVDQDWFNMVQEELLAVVQAGGLTPDKSNRGQLLAAIEALINGGGSHSWGIPGYKIEGSGFIEQWGEFTISASGVSTFSGTQGLLLPFPNAFFGVTIQAKGPGRSDWNPITTLSSPIDLDSFHFNVDTTSDSRNFTQAVTVFWRAIGH